MWRMSSPYEQPNPADQPGQQPPYGAPSPYGQQPAPYGQPPAQYGQPYGGAPTEHPQGSTVFILGIVGIFVGVCAPIAWYLGNKTLGEITASGQQYSNLQQIKTGRTLGKVFTIIYIVFIVLYIIFIIAIVAIGAGSSR